MEDKSVQMPQWTSALIDPHKSELQTDIYVEPIAASMVGHSMPERAMANHRLLRLCL